MVAAMFEVLILMSSHFLICQVSSSTNLVNKYLMSSSKKLLRVIRFIKIGRRMVVSRGWGKRERDIFIYLVWDFSFARWTSSGDLFDNHVDRLERTEPYT